MYMHVHIFIHMHTYVHTYVRRLKTGPCYFEFLEKAFDGKIIAYVQVNELKVHVYVHTYVRMYVCTRVK